jgi:hypothetical protein
MKPAKNSHILALGLGLAGAMFLLLVFLCMGCSRPPDPVVHDLATVRSVWFDGYSKTVLVVEYSGGATGSLTACGIPPVWVGVHGDLYKTWNSDRECYVVHVVRK